MKSDEEDRDFEGELSSLLGRLGTELNPLLAWTNQRLQIYQSELRELIDTSQLCDTDGRLTSQSKGIARNLLVRISDTQDILSAIQDSARSYQFSKWLVKQRNLRSWSPFDLSRAADISINTIINIEDGLIDFDRNIILRLAEAFAEDDDQAKTLIAEALKLTGSEAEQLPS